MEQSAEKTAETEEAADDPDALKRAVLAERYEEERNEAAVDVSDDSAEAERASSDAWAAVKEFISPTQTRSRVTGINVKPEIPASLDEAIDADEIEAVQFELDGTMETQWYTWAPSEENAALTRIVETYTNGDISDLYGMTVDVAPTDKLTITYPTPHDKHTGHLSYRLWRRLNAAQTASIDYHFTDAELEQGHLIDGYDELSLSYAGQIPTGAQRVSLVGGILVTLCTVVALALGGPFFGAVAALVGLFAHTLLGMSVTPNASQWYKPFKPIIKAPYVAIRGTLSRIARRLNQR